jgi:hypothetical protein
MLVSISNCQNHIFCIRAPDGALVSDNETTEFNEFAAAVDASNTLTISSSSIRLATTAI